MAIIFDEVSSDSLGVYVEGYPSRPLGRRRISPETIPGYNGYYLVDEGAYDGYEQEYRLSWLPTDVIDTDIISWLTKLGYKKLVDTDKAGYHRMAIMLDLPDIENVGGLYHTVKVSFLCKPEYYLDSGDIQQVMSSGNTINNPTLYPSHPILTISGASSGVELAINGRIITFTAEVSSCTIDCEREECYNGATPLNSSIDCSDFPILSSGDNPIVWTGTIEEVKITPRWWTR